MSDVQIVVRTERRDERRTVTTGTTAADLFEGDREVVVARVNDVLRDLDPRARRRRRRRAGRRRQRRTGSPCCGTPPRTCSRRPCRRSTRRPSSASGRRSATASTTTSTSPSPSPPTTSRPSRRRWQRIVKEGQTFRRRVVTDDEAREELADEPYKLELIGLKAGPSGTPSADDGDRPRRPRWRRSADGASVEVGAGELTIYDNLRRDGVGRLEGPVPRAAPARPPGCSATASS